MNHRSKSLAAVSLIVALSATACSKKSEEAPSPSPVDSGARGTAPSSSASSPAPAPSAAPAPAKPANVLFLTVDSMRAEMPWNGYPRPIAPNLTALAETCTNYTNAYSISSYTAKSVATFLSGRYPSTLYRDGWFFAGYAKANHFLAETLQERGIRTLSWHGHMYFSRAKGLEQGFDEWRIVPGITFDAQTDNHVTSDKMTALGIELLQSPDLAQKQFFAWAHYMDPHDEYKKHAESPDFGKKARDRYDSELFFTDLWLGKLLDFAKSQPWWQNTVVIISADHGEAFGEHGMYKHAFELWEVLTRVPLLVCGPGIRAQKIAERRSHIDLAPTILDLMGVPVPAEYFGKTLVPELRGAAQPENREPIVMDLSEDSHNPPRRAVIVGDYKYIWRGPREKAELYDLKTDPGEEKNLAKENAAKFQELTKVYEDVFTKLPIVEPYGHMKLKEGGVARGPTGPEAKP